MKRIACFLAILMFFNLALGGVAGAYPTGWTSDKAVGASTGKVDVAVKGNIVHLAYENNGIYYCRSTDKGVTWSSPRKVNLGSWTVSSPQVSTGSGDSVYIAYVSEERPGANHTEALVRRSQNSGQSWESGYFAYAGSSTDNLIEAALTHGSDSVSIAWRQWLSSGYAAYWSPLGAGGNLGNYKRQVWDSTTTDDPEMIRAASDGTSVFITYMAHDAYSPDVYCMRFDGSTTSHDVISSGSHSFGDPDISCQGPGVFDVVWTDSYNGDNKVFRRIWNGSSWGSASILYDAGSQQPAARAVPYSPDNSAICLDSTGTCLEWAMFGSNVDVIKGSAPAGWATDRASGGETFVACRCSDGNIRVKRTDSIPPSATGLTVGGNQSGGVTYAKANCSITFNTVGDDWNLTGTDASGDAFTNGVSSIQMKCSSAPSGPWGNLPTDKGSTLDNAPWTARVDTSSMGDGTWYMKGVLTDTAGNTRDVASGPVVIDSTPPTASASTDPAHDPATWRTSPTTITITGSDANLDHVEYVVLPDGQATGTWSTYTGPLSAPEGKNSIHYRAYDKAGNASSEYVLGAWVDTSPPTCTITDPKGTEVFPAVDSTYHMLGGLVTDSAVVASGSIWIDGKKVYETTDAGTFNMGYNWNTEGVPLGNHTIQVKGTDEAGHAAASVLKTFKLIENPAVDWYFAEGTTREGFDEFISVLDANNRDAHLHFDFMLETGQVLTKDLALKARSRTTLNVKDIVPPGHDVSVHLHSDGSPVIAERPMYFDYQGKWTGGHDGTGSNSLQKRYYFAEGTTRTAGNGGPFEEWITIQNPGDRAANVRVTYMLATGRNITKTYSVTAHTRVTCNVNSDVGPEQDVSALVESDRPVAAERPMYFDYHRAWDGGHIVAGAPDPGKTWYFPEGCTRKGFAEWITVMNPGARKASVTLHFYPEDSSGKDVKVDVEAGSRATCDVAAMAGADHDVATRVTSDVPVVAERPMYFDYKGWTGGSDTLGASVLGRCFYFAEGTTRPGFDEWATVFSPSDGAMASVVLLYPDGTKDGPISYLVGPTHRTTIDINKAAGGFRDVSLEVVGDNDIVVERPMYFDYNGWTGGHTSCGLKAN